MTPIVALSDGNVLFPPSLRDFLVWLTIAGACRARWSDVIHDEWIRNVLAAPPQHQAGEFGAVPPTHGR